jgi:tRNA1(Val) A37 N6-methylase TrmN6
VGRFESTATVRDFSQFAASILRPEGDFVIVYPYNVHERALNAMLDVFGNVRVINAFDNPEAPTPTLVFAQSTLGSETKGIFEETPICLHAAPRRDVRKRQYDPEFESFLRKVAGVEI